MMVDCRGRFLQPTRLHSIKGKSPEKCNSKRLQDRSRQHLKEARRKQQATTTTFRDTLEGHLARKIFLPPSVSQTTWMVGWSVGTLKSTMFFSGLRCLAARVLLMDVFLFLLAWGKLYSRAVSSFLEWVFKTSSSFRSCFSGWKSVSVGCWRSFFFSTFSPFSFRPWWTIRMSLRGISTSQLAPRRKVEMPEDLFLFYLAEAAVSSPPPGCKYLHAGAVFRAGMCALDKRWKLLSLNHNKTSRNGSQKHCEQPAQRQLVKWLWLVTVTATCVCVTVLQGVENL